MGELDGKVTARVTQLAKVFTGAGIETEVSTNIHQLIWNKLFVNITLKR